MERTLPGGEGWAGNAPSPSSPRDGAARLEQLTSERQLKDDGHGYRSFPNPGHGPVVLFGSHQHQEEQTHQHSYEDQLVEQMHRHGRHPLSTLVSLTSIDIFIITLSI